MDQRMIEAAQSGSIDVLYDLIHEDPYVLEHIDEVPFIHTPLHIAAEYGRTSFAMEVMNLKPSFARKLSTNGFSPLHLALENDHAQCALELLEVDPSLVRVRGRQGMTAMHLVVTKGDIRLLTEFLLACPECIRDVNVKGQTSLHIAVMNDRYEELRVLIGWIERMTQKNAELLEFQLVNRRDHDGNTALHLAAYEDKPQVMRLLLKTRPVNLNVQNKEGLTPLDILQTRRPREYTDIEKIIRKSEGKNASSIPKIKTISEFLRSPVTFLQYWSTNWARYRSRMSDGTSNAFLVIATLIITTTYQTALQPPGGVHQANSSTGAGTAVMNSNYFRLLRKFNGMALWTATFTIFSILPGGRDNIVWFLSILVPLYISYIVSWCVISPEPSPYISTSVTVVMYILVVYLVFFLAWKRSKKVNKIPEPRSKIVSEGLARGMEC